MSPSHPPKDYRPPQLLSSKRRLIMTGALAALAVPTWSTIHAALAAPAALPSVVASPAFVSVSQLLTGHATLDQSLTRRLYRAFSAQDPAFPQKIQQLADFIAARPALDQLLAALEKDAPALAKLPQAIMQGWYVGVVGKGEHAQCVAYVDTLASIATAQYVSPPTYSYGQYGSWASNPV